MPDRTPEQEQRLEAVLAEYFALLEAGQAPASADWIASHPELAAELTEFFADRRGMEQLAGPLRPPTPADAPTLAPGPTLSTARSDGVRSFGDYEILAEIARGGMGVVYKARQVSLNRVVAVKMILAGELASPDAVQRFRAEAEAASQLDHPNILPIHEVGEWHGQHYFSMKLVEGGNLSQVVARNRWPVASKEGQRQAAGLVALVARAVHHAHQRGVLHRDLKPANVLVDAEGTPYVADFGLARRVEGGAGATRTGDIVGTANYMPPEQARGQRQLTMAADVYSLGAILYELLTGRAPFVGSNPLDIILQVLEREPVAPRTLVPSIDRDLETICLKCLEKEPARRYASAAELADDLDRWRAGLPILARPVGRVERAVKWVRRHALVSALAAAILLVLVAGVVVSSYFAYSASLEATAAREAEDKAEAKAAEAERAARRADKEAGDAERAAKRADDEARRARRSLALTNLRQAADLALSDPERARMLVEDATRLPLDEDLGFARGMIARLSRPEVHSFPYRADPFASKMHVSPSGGTVLFHQGAWLGLVEWVSGRQLGAWRIDYDFGARARGIVLSADGKRCAFRPETLGLQPTQSVVLDLVTGKEMRLAGTAQRDDLAPLGFTPDGTALMTGSKEGIDVFDLDTGKHIRHSPGALDWTLRRFAVSPGGAVAARAANRDILLFDPAGKQVGRLPGTKDGLWFLGYPDDQTLVTGWGRTDPKVNAQCYTDLRAWDVTTGKERQRFEGHSGQVRELVLTRTGHLVGVHPEGLIVWGVGDGTVRHTIPAPVGTDRGRDWDISPDGRYFGHTVAAAVQVWDLNTGQLAALLPGGGQPFAFAFSSDGRIATTRRVEVGLAERFEVRVFTLDGGRLDAIVRGPQTYGTQAPEDIGQVAFTPDGRRLLGTTWRNDPSGPREPIVYVWNVAPLRTSLRLDMPANPQGESILTAFHAAGDRFLSVTGSPRRLLDLEGFRAERPSGNVLTCAGIPVFSPSGRLVADRQADGSVKVWRPQEGQPIADRPPAFHLVGNAGITVLSLSEDHLATADADGMIRLWPLTPRPGEKPTPVELNGGKGDWGRLAFSADGRSLAAYQRAGHVRLWDLTDRSAPQNAPFQDLKGTRRTDIPNLVFAAQEKTLVLLGMTNQVNQIEAWRLSPKGPAQPLPLDAAAASSPRFSPDQNYLVWIQNHERALRALVVYDLVEGRRRCTVTSSRWPSGACLAPANDILAVVEHTREVDDRRRLSEVRLYDGRTGEPGVQAIWGTLALAPDGKTLAVAYNQGTRLGTDTNRPIRAVLQLWDLTTGQQAAELPAEGCWFYALSFNASSSALCGSGEARRPVPGQGHVRTGLVCHWEVERDLRGTLGDHARPVRRLALSPGGDMVAAAKHNHGGTRLWDLRTGRALRDLDAAVPYPTVLRFAADGGTLFTNTTEKDVVSLGRFDVATGRKTTAFAAPEGHFPTDGRTLLRWSKQEGDPLHVEDLTGTRNLHAPPFAPSRWRVVAFSPDGRTIALRDDKERVRLWDLLSGEEPAKLADTEVQADSLAFSADGKLLAGADASCGIAVWNTATGARVGEGRRNSSFRNDFRPTLMWVPDGKALAVLAIDNNGKGIEIVRVHEIKKGLPVRHILGVAEAPVTAVAASPCGRFLATGSKDWHVRLWRLADGGVAKVFRGHRGPITALAFAADGTTLLSGGADGAVRIWNVPR
jgi:WD40 repeat protein